MESSALMRRSAALPDGKSQQAAILAVLKPEQRQAYRDAQAKRLADARKEMEVIGLTLPDDSEMFDPLDF